MTENNRQNSFHTLLKPFARANAVPLDRDEIWESISAVEQYVNSPLAYAGQTIKVKMEDGKYHSYTLQPSENGVESKLVLETLKGEIVYNTEKGIDYFNTVFCEPIYPDVFQNQVKNEILDTINREWSL
mgnify:CR=1 FL=1